MVIEKAEIAAKLSKLKSAVPSRTAIPALQGILLKNGLLTAYNLEFGIQAKLDNPSNEQMVIPVKAIDMIEALPDGRIDITANETNDLVIKATSITNRFSSFAVADYPEVPAFDGRENFIIECSQLTEALASVVYAAADTYLRPVLTGLCFEARDGVLNIVGCDGVRLSWYQLPLQQDFKFVVPKDSIQRLMSLKLRGSVQISYDDKRVIFKTDDYTVFSRLLDGEYLKFKQTVPQYTNTVQISRTGITECVRRSVLCLDNGLNNPIKLEFKESHLDLSINSPMSDYFENMPLETPAGSGLVIGFDAHFLYDALRSFTGDSIEVSLGTELTPILLKDGPLTAMVCPKRLK